MGLIIESDGNRVTEEVVRKVGVPPYTRSFMPVRNDELLDMVYKVADNYGLELDNGQFGLARKDQRMFGAFDVVNHSFMNGGANFKLGVRNSCDKSVSASICFGSEICVCSNLIFAGYPNGENGVVGHTGHKHTTFVHDKLYDRLMVSFSQFELYKHFQEDFYNKLSEKSLSNARACELIVESARHGVIPKKDILDVANEWDFQARGPRDEAEQERYHPEFAPRNAFSLCNAFTEIHKNFQKRNIVEAPNRSMNLVSFLHKQFVVN